MDLESVLQKVINSIELPVAIKRGYMNGKKLPELRIYMLPGSNVIDCDYDGNKTEQFNFEIAMRADDEALINECLFSIAEMLGSTDFSVTSSDRSFLFNSLQLTSFPHVISIDVSGVAVYVLDFQVVVDTFNK
ncbi:minor capsid protein [Ligilactobacillus apodemi]|uniref:minor capsid protein n=1 Tax=Ligilactobacillus apodemi TaxID=307126 RepID=UPI00214C7FB3|nr:minor capsid protein [Ligilactobacillus apodemi]MCR1902293.1 minor capsid protein [Ligilactobacillus apodemi]